MAGSYIKVEYRGEKSLTNALNSLLKQGSNLAPVLGDIGEYLLPSTQQRFVEMQAPDGSPWAELSSTTLELKAAKGARLDRILTESGTLADTLHYQISADTLSLGSNEEYAAMHQFGGITSPSSMIPGVEIPAREFLGMAPFEKNEVEAIVVNYLAKGLP
ncbi:phage virion morphogenesis protein [Shewanella chilikensis]|uniref:phage virion morphogenesis protein n=1 Tax=Shewanella TaxID=22 RepID=UPI001C55D185|nr:MULTISPECIES: phage virion morphogenesis protein [Shewanella]MCL1162468.1 phage virion morphogenesis protein [Shewanella chilikensis]